MNLFKDFNKTCITGNEMTLYYLNNIQTMEFLEIYDCNSISTVTLPDRKTQVKIYFNIIPTSAFSAI